VIVSPIPISGLLTTTNPERVKFPLWLDRVNFIEERWDACKVFCRPETNDARRKRHGFLNSIGRDVKARPTKWIELLFLCVVMQPVICYWATWLKRRKLAELDEVKRMLDDTKEQLSAVSLGMADAGSHTKSTACQLIACY
jgi:hypothetical protein